MTVFLTGTTGFLGQTLAHRLAESGMKIFALVRNYSQVAETGLQDFENIEWVVGDITNPSIFNSLKIRLEIQAQVTHLIHLAAQTQHEAPLSEFDETNRAGTQNVIDFAKQCPKLSGFYFSSSLGAVPGAFTQRDALAGSKCAAEEIVQSWSTQAQKWIFRFGNLVGRSDDGATSKIDGLYYLMHIIEHEKGLRRFFNKIGLVALPFSRRAKLHLTPVDTAAEIFHLAITRNPSENCLTTKVIEVTDPGGGYPCEMVFRDLASFFGLTARILPTPNTFVTRAISGFLGVPSSTTQEWYCTRPVSPKQLFEQFPTLAHPHFGEFAPRVFGYAKEHLFACDEHGHC